MNVIVDGPVMSRNTMIEKIVPRRCFDNATTNIFPITNSPIQHVLDRVIVKGCTYDEVPPNREERRKKKKQKGKVKLAKL